MRNLGEVFEAYERWRRGTRRRRSGGRCARNARSGADIGNDRREAPPLTAPRRTVDAMLPLFPSMFRLTLINTTKQCERMHTKTPAQRHARRSCCGDQGFELYLDISRSMRLDGKRRA